MEKSRHLWAALRRRGPSLPVLLLLVFITGLLSRSASASNTEVIDPLLRQQMVRTPPAGQLPVIVTLREQVDLARFAEDPPMRGMGGEARRSHRERLIRALRGQAERSQSGIRSRLRGRGVEHIRSLWLTNGLAFSADPALISDLSAMPEVASIRYDEVVKLPRVIPAADGDLNAVEDNIDLIKAPALWLLGYTGQGVTVAILDSGVDVQHPELGPRWRGGANSWFNAVAANCSNPQVTCITSCDTSATEPCDYLDGQGIAHGTGVAGLLVGGSAGGTAIGVAPGAQWIAAKIFDSGDNAPLSIIHQAFAWFLDPDGDPATDDVPDVVNGSWTLGSFGTCIQEFSPDIQALKVAGVAVVFSAGNAGPNANTSSSPANDPGSFAVGSVGNAFFTQATDVSDFSSRGPSSCDDSVYPEVVAPGFVKTTDFSIGGIPLYINLAGTSFSAPQAAGIFALLLDAFPGASPAELEAAVAASAADLGGVGPDNDYGYGLVNALAAYQSLGGIPSLGIHDPSPPENDRSLDFGNVPPGESRDLLVTLANVGGGLLGIASVGGGLAEPFAVGTDGCSGSVLAAGEACAVTVRFAPTTHGESTGALEVLSDVGASAVVLNGVGNNPPAAASLVAPVDGATGLDTDVTFQWSSPDDPDGDPVTDSLLLSKSTDFSLSTPIVVSAAPPAVRFAGFGGLLLLSGLGFLRRCRRRDLLCAALIVGVLTLLLSCGGGGSSGGGSVSGPDSGTTVTGLDPATTYYWKIVSEDGLGGSAESDVWQFTTR